jgi:hypothetical protein
MINLQKITEDAFVDELQKIANNSKKPIPEDKIERLQQHAVKRYNAGKHIQNASLLGSIASASAFPLTSNKYTKSALIAGAGLGLYGAHKGSQMKSQGRGAFTMGSMAKAYNTSLKNSSGK